MEKKKTQSSYPLLASLAREYLSVPGTSVPSKRAFSTTGLPIIKQRPNLGFSSVDGILFLNKNLRKTSILQAENVDCQSPKNQTVTVKSEIHVKERKSRQLLICPCSHLCPISYMYLRRWSVEVSEHSMDINECYLAWTYSFSSRAQENGFINPFPVARVTHRVVLWWSLH